MKGIRGVCVEGSREPGRLSLDLRAPQLRHGVEVVERLSEGTAHGGGGGRCARVRQQMGGETQSGKGLWRGGSVQPVGGRGGSEAMG